MTSPATDIAEDPAGAESAADDVRSDREFAVAEGDDLLRVENLTVQFGGVTALDDVSFTIRRGEILGLIGPNGAGKTTCFNAMTGVYKPTHGRVVFDGTDLSGRRESCPHATPSSV